MTQAEIDEELRFLCVHISEMLAVSSNPLVQRGLFNLTRRLRKVRREVAALKIEEQAARNEEEVK